MARFAWKQRERKRERKRKKRKRKEGRRRESKKKGKLSAEPAEEFTHASHVTQLEHRYVSLRAPRSTQPARTMRGERRRSVSTDRVDS